MGSDNLYLLVWQRGNWSSSYEKNSSRTYVTLFGGGHLHPIWSHRQQIQAGGIWWPLSLDRAGRENRLHAVMVTFLLLQLIDVWWMVERWMSFAASGLVSNEYILCGPEYRKKTKGE